MFTFVRLNRVHREFTQRSISIKCAPEFQFRPAINQKIVSSLHLTVFKWHLVVWTVNTHRWPLNNWKQKKEVCVWFGQTVPVPFRRRSLEKSSQAASSCCHCQKQSRLLGLRPCSRRTGKYSGQFSACWLKHLTNLWWLTQQLFVSKTPTITITTS